MGLKAKVENHPVMVVIVALGVIGAIKTSFFSKPAPTYSNSGSGTFTNAGRDVNINESRRDKDPNTPEGAREALVREGKQFDEEGFGDAVREGNLEQIRLYLSGGKSPNDLYNHLPLLSVAISNSAPHFAQMLSLFAKWKPDPLDFKRIDNRIVIYAKIRDIPQTQQDALFAQLAYSLGPGDDSTPTYVREDAELLIKSGAKPDGVIAALQKANKAISTSETDALRHGVNQEQDAQILGNKTPKEMIAENTQMIAFLQSLGH